MNHRLDNQVALVTGGARGLGRAMCVELGMRGAFVVVNYKVSESEAAETLDLVCRAGGKGMLHRADVSNPQEVTEMCKLVTKEVKTIDILVNNAGATRDEYFLMMRTSSWDDLVKVHLDATFYCSKAVIRGMCARGRGVIVNIGSGAGLVAMPGQVNYSATKSGLLGFTKSLAREVAPKGVRVFTLAPGFFRTDMTEVLDKGFRDETYRRTPMGRWGEPTELAQLLSFLASDKGRYFTGQTIPVDGGRGTVEAEYGF